MGPKASSKEMRLLRDRVFSLYIRLYPQQWAVVFSGMQAQIKQFYVLVLLHVLMTLYSKPGSRLLSISSTINWLFGRAV